MTMKKKNQITMSGQQQGLKMHQAPAIHKIFSFPFISY